MTLGYDRQTPHDGSRTATVTYDPNATITVNGEEWYRPECAERENGLRGRHFVSVQIHPTNGAIVECSCGEVTPLSRQDVHALREPERLKARMAEVMSGRGW